MKIKFMFGSIVDSGLLFHRERCDAEDLFGGHVET